MEKKFYNEAIIEGVANEIIETIDNNISSYGKFDFDLNGAYEEAKKHLDTETIEDFAKFCNMIAQKLECGDYIKDIKVTTIGLFITTELDYFYDDSISIDFLDEYTEEEDI